jgi:hypothetical protein
MGQRINQGNFHINLFPWRSGEDLCPHVNMHDHVTSRVILDCVHLALESRHLAIFVRYMWSYVSRCFLYISNNLVQGMKCSVVVNKYIFLYPVYLWDAWFNTFITPGVHAFYKWGTPYGEILQHCRSAFSRDIYNRYNLTAPIVHQFRVSQPIRDLLSPLQLM